MKRVLSFVAGSVLLVGCDPSSAPENRSDQPALTAEPLTAEQLQARSMSRNFPELADIATLLQKDSDWAVRMLREITAMQKTGEVDFVAQFERALSDQDIEIDGESSELL